LTLNSTPPDRRQACGSTWEAGALCPSPGAPLPSPAFLEMVLHHFHIADASQIYHWPFKLTAWGFSL